MQKIIKKSNIENILAFFLITLPLSFFLGSLFVNIYLILISVLYLLNQQTKKQIFEIHKKNFLIFLFFFMIFIITVFTQNNFNNILKSFALIKFFYLYLALEYFILHNRYKMYKKIIYSSVIIYIVFFLDLLIQIYLKKNILGYEPSMCLNINNFDTCQRYSGFFGDELIAGAFISTVLFGFFLIIKNIFEFKYMNIVPLFLLFFTLLTGERSASLIIFMLNIIFYYFLFMQYSTKKKIVFTLLVSLAGILFYNFILPDPVRSRYFAEVSGYINLKDENLVLNNKLDNILKSPWGRHYHSSYLIFLEKPIFGHGLKSFRNECRKYEINIKGSCSTHPHNFHLEILNDGGIFLYVIFILMIIKFLMYNDFFNQPKVNNLIYIIMLLIFIFLPRPTGALFSTTFGTMFWFLTAVFVNIGRKID